MTAKGRNSDRIYTLKYEDGEVETIDLATERFRFLGGAKRSAASASATNANDQSKRRRINDDDDSDEEFEFDDEVSDEDDDKVGKASKANRRPSMSDGSEFLASENDEEMDDDDSEEEFEFDEEEEDLEDSEDEEAPMVTGELYQTHVGRGIETSWIERTIPISYIIFHFCLTCTSSSFNEIQTKTRKTLDMEQPAARRRIRSRPVVVPKRRRRSR